jgi:hypothetical protein
MTLLVIGLVLLVLWVALAILTRGARAQREAHFPDADDTVAGMPDPRPSVSVGPVDTLEAATRVRGLWSYDAGVADRPHAKGISKR